MISPAMVVVAAIAYLLLLFAIAAWGDRRAAAGRSVIDSAGVYALSWGVYCYRLDLLRQRRASGGLRRRVPADLPRADAGDAARLGGAAEDGADQHGPTASPRSPTSSPSRYGKSRASRRAGDGHRRHRDRALHRAAAEGRLRQLSRLLTIREVARRPRPVARLVARQRRSTSRWLLAAFAIVFGTRHLDASERHEGMVAAIAFESRGQARRLPRGRRLRDLGALRRLRPTSARAAQAVPALPAANGLGAAGYSTMRSGSRSPCCRCWRSCSCRGSSRSWSSRTSTSSTSGKADLALSALSAGSSTSSSCRSPSAGSCFPGARRRCRHLRAVPADGRKAAPALALLAFVGGLSAPPAW